MSLYGVWAGNDNDYFHFVARAGEFDSELHSKGDFPDSADYKNKAYSISAEYGKRFMLPYDSFVELQSQFTLGHLKQADYTTKRGSHGDIDGMSSAIGRMGMRFGKETESGNALYLKLNALHEFAGTRTLTFTHAENGLNEIYSKENNYKDTWVETGVGGNLNIKDNLNLYGNIETGFGGDINKKWEINAGLRWSF